MEPDDQGDWVRYSDLAAARAEIERLTKRAEIAEAERDRAMQASQEIAHHLTKAEAERDEALARGANANRMSATGYSAGFAAGVNAAVAAYDSAIAGDVHNYGIERMLDLLAVPTPSPETESDDYASAVKERDEARAQVAAAYEAAAKVIPHASGTLVGESLGQKLCCNGHVCGCQGATVGLYLQHLIRALTPADAKATYEAYGREKAREGMKQAAKIVRANCPECQGTGLRDSGGVHPWGEPIEVPCDCTDAILAAMEELK